MKEIQKIYSYEKMKRILERLDAIDGGDQEEECKDEDQLITKI